jgi:hypothetical protein
VSTGDYSLTLAYMDNTKAVAQTYAGSLDSGSRTLTLTLATGSSTPILFIPTPGAPSGLQADRSGSATRLTWTACTDPEVTRLPGVCPQSR